MSGHQVFVMPVLTVYQPWAEMIITGVKDVENRVWSAKHRGRIWIHASNTRTNREAVTQYSERLFHLRGRDRLPQGVIVGSVELYEVRDDAHRGLSEWAREGHRHWMLRNPLALDEPLVWTGAMGLRVAHGVPAHLTDVHIGHMM